MAIFKYKTDIETLQKRKVPKQPGVTEFSFYIMGKDMPAGVPSGANPREQNIDKPTYKKVTESFNDNDDQTFHLKNKGITTLAVSATVEEFPDGTAILTVEIPDELGNV